MNQLRLGFLGTAGIARKNWQAVFHSGNAVVAAVASRDAARAGQFIADCQRQCPFAEPPQAFGSYEELLASPRVDAVYVPLPTALRADLVVRAAELGRHVLCEKPCATDGATLDRMLAACERQRVQFLDGVMFMHSPRLARLRAVLDDGVSVGAPHRIASSFTFSAAPGFLADNIRAHGGLEPAGCLGDLGWYSIRFTLWALRWRLPRQVTAWTRVSSPGSPGRPANPMDFSAELDFGDGLTGSFYCSFLTGGQQWVHVSGERGWLCVPDFVHPCDSYAPGWEVNHRPARVDTADGCPAGADPKASGHASAQDTLMWRNFARQIQSGRLNPDWPMWARQTQRVMDACLESARQGRPVQLSDRG